MFVPHIVFSLMSHTNVCSVRSALRANFVSVSFSTCFVLSGNLYDNPAQK